MPLWTKANYGGTGITSNIASVPNSFKILSVLSTSHGGFMGLFFYLDVGRCTYVGRDADFSICKGQRSEPEDMVIVPGVFQKWEQPDPVTYLFTVRKGVLWPATPPMARTNREVTAEDIVFYLNVSRKEGIIRDTFTLVKDVQAVDRYTVKVTMLSPQADFILGLSAQTGGIFSKECYDVKGCLDDVKSTSPGAWLVKEYIARQKLVIEKNPEFFLKGLPYLDGITVLNITDPAALKANFLVGKTEDGLSNLTLDEAEDLRKKNAEFQFQSICGTGNVSTSGFRARIDVGPTADLRVRRAMAMVLDLPTMFEAAAPSNFSMPGTILSRHYFGDEFYMTIDQMGENYQFNPVKAKQLLVEAGYPNGFPLALGLHINTGPTSQEALYAQAQWKKYLNMDVKITVFDTGAHALQYQEGTWDGLWFQHNAWSLVVGGTAADDAILSFTKGSATNVQHLNDAKINDLYIKQRGELDPAKRVKLLWDFEQYEMTQLYVIRVGCYCTLNVMQPWVMNGLMHGTSFGSGVGTGGTGIPTMFDPIKAPRSR